MDQILLGLVASSIYILLVRDSFAFIVMDDAIRATHLCKELIGKSWIAAKLGNKYLDNSPCIGLTEIEMLPL